MTDPNEIDIFEEILAAYDFPDYNPELHLSPTVAAERWKIDRKSAITRLRRDAEKLGLIETQVRNPATGHSMIVFAKKNPAG